MVVVRACLLQVTAMNPQWLWSNSTAWAFMEVNTIMCIIMKSIQLAFQLTEIALRAWERHNDLRYGHHNCAYFL